MDNQDDAQDDKKISYLHVPCKPEEKGRWIQESRRKKMKLVNWVIEVLNKEIAKDK